MLIYAKSADKKKLIYYTDIKILKSWTLYHTTRLSKNRTMRIKRKKMTVLTTNTTLKCVQILKSCFIKYPSLVRRKMFMENGIQISSVDIH